MKGIITIKVKNEIEIYIKASNLQGTMEGTVVRKDWSDILNKQIEFDIVRSITINQYSLEDSILKIKMDMRKDTGLFHFDLKLEKNADDTYSAKLGGPDLFTWPSLILSILLAPFIIIYFKLKSLFS